MGLLFDSACQLATICFGFNMHLYHRSRKSRKLGIFFCVSVRRDTIPLGSSSLLCDSVRSMRSMRWGFYSHVSVTVKVTVTVYVILL